ncbi:zinc ribbon domain-containing protein [Yinghuangia sp. ASG 101]|uniref:FmdB family zinc ribbon protein n=1 Tax=Yinghuangia sp. ASG 101 TaxID=2896848 RepID=UPI001E2BB65D|nr:zinc ribbon domain-containing protein [Yinghuangia sp. ASG 101]UGQ14051.1 zinc ribbon domain-containing protein [Yinghuangia sp. ASG 101]
MPNYEFRCRACGDTFTVSRPMAESSAPASCPAGHGDTVKLLSAVAISGSRGSGPSPAPTPPPSGGGACCGGGCCG